MASDWLPLHENHAINVMALVLTFAEPIPAPMFRKAFAAVEASAVDGGLAHRQPAMNSLQFSMQHGILQPVQQTTSGGTIFSSYFENHSFPFLPPQLSEQLQVEPTSIVYRTWGYVSWTWQRARYFELLRNFYESIAGLVAPATVRFEYQDRFVFDGSPKDADPRRLLKSDSPYLSPHVLNEKGMWHSHTGFFLESNDIAQKLLQINVDAVDEGAGESLQRWVNITTARENRYPSGPDDMVALDMGLIAAAMDSQHTELKSALGLIINDATASRIYLEG